MICNIMIGCVTSDYFIQRKTNNISRNFTAEIIILKIDKKFKILIIFFNIRKHQKFSIF